MTGARVDRRRRALSDADRARAVAMAEAGRGSTTIAHELGKRQPTVASYLATLGLVRSRQVDVAEPFAQAGGTRKRFSREEDAFVEGLAVAGVGHGEIARLCTERFGHPRRASAVRARLMSLAAVGERSGNGEG